MFPLVDVDFSLVTEAQTGGLLSPVYTTQDNVQHQQYQIYLGPVGALRFSSSQPCAESEAYKAKR
jgi:hypothetical protein